MESKVGTDCRANSLADECLTSPLAYSPLSTSDSCRWQVQKGQWLSAAVGMGRGRKAMPVETEDHTLEIYSKCSRTGGLSRHRGLRMFFTAHARTIKHWYVSANSVAMIIVLLCDLTIAGESGIKPLIFYFEGVISSKSSSSSDDSNTNRRRLYHHRRRFVES